MENYKVSIIIPIYKVENYLSECLDSCINQTYTNIEIITVNDGSPDNCGDIIDSYAAKDSRITHIKKKNEGVAIARKTGINTSTGDYLLFVDGDDFLAPNAVEIYMDVIVRENADMVFSDFINHYSNTKNIICQIPLRNGLVIDGIEDYFNHRGRMEIWGRIIKRELCLDCEIQELNMGEDLFAMTQILMKCNKIVYQKTALYYYRHNATSLMHKQDAVSNEIEHKLFLIAFLIRKKYPKNILHFLIMTVVPIVSKYCNDYDNTTTIEKKEDMKRLITLSLKHYPNMLWKNLFTDRIKGVIVLYILHYFPNSAKLIHKYNKLRGKKNHEL